MLQVEMRFMIKDLHRKGLSVSEIARLTGHYRKTVRRVIGAPLLPTPAVRRRKPRKLDPYVPYLERRMAEGVFNVPKLLREIRSQGYTGGITQLRLFVQPHRPAPASVATLRFETDPDEQAQVHPVTEGIPFLGFIVFPERRRLKSRTGIAFARRLRVMAQRCADGEIAFDQVTAAVQGWVNHARYANTTALRKAVLSEVRLQPPQA